MRRIFAASIFISLILLCACQDEEPSCSKFESSGLEVEVLENPTSEDENGVVRVSMKDESSETAEYSLDGQTYQKSAEFEGLKSGSHTVYARSFGGCITFKSFFLSSNHILSVNNGTGSGSYAEGESVNIMANDPETGKVFSKWTGDVENVDNINEPNTELVMPAKSIEVSAAYESILYTLTVDKGSGSGQYPMDSVITITAEEPELAGYVFDQWTGQVDSVGDVSSAVTTVTMPASDVSIAASYKEQQYTLEVINGSGSGTYTYGTMVSIEAIEGRLFSKWDGDIGELENESSASTTITITQDTQVRALFNDITFSGDVLPLVEDNCKRCHPFFSNHTNIKGEIDRMVELMEQCAMPLGGDCIAEDKVDLIVQWIDSGYPDN